MTEVVATNQTILVVGGGISGMTAAIEAAECGKQVVLVEKSPTLGGRTALLYRYFPKLCHPTCGLEINLRRIGWLADRFGLQNSFLLTAACELYVLFYALWGSRPTAALHDPTAG